MSDTNEHCCSNGQCQCDKHAFGECYSDMHLRECMENNAVEQQEEKEEQTEDQEEKEK